MEGMVSAASCHWRALVALALWGGQGHGYASSWPWPLLSLWGDHAAAQAWVLPGKGGVSPAPYNLPDMAALVGSSPQEPISCWWLNTKWSTAVPVAVTAGAWDPPTVGPFRANVQQPPGFISAMCGSGDGKFLPLLVLSKDGGLVCVCVCFKVAGLWSDAWEATSHLTQQTSRRR